MFNDKSEYISKIIRYYIEILERKPTSDEINSQIAWMNDNKISLEQLPEYFRKSTEFDTLQNFKKIGEGPIITHDGMMMYLNKHDNVLSRHLAYHKVWEPYQTLVTKKFLQNNTEFVDVGANIGYYSILAASVAKTGHITSFEPEPNNFEILKKNVILNNLENVNLHQLAVTNKNEETLLYLNSIGNAGDHRIFSKNLSSEKENRRNIKIMSTTLDEFLIHRSVPDIIKMDIQGSEMLAIKGMKKTLEESKRLILFTEFWPEGISASGESPIEFLSSLSDYGFKICEINEAHNKIEKKSNEQLLDENIRNSAKYKETSLICLKNITTEFT